MGTSQAKLTVLPSRTVFLTGQPQANISDHLSMVNLVPFGRCRSLGFPATASATAAAHGKLTPMPCMHNTPFPWMGGKNDYLVKGQPALLKSSTCSCMWGGTISITDNGQHGEGTQWVQKKEKEAFQPKDSIRKNISFENTLKDSDNESNKYSIVPLEKSFVLELETIKKMAKEAGNEIQGLAVEIANNHNANCTPINYKSPNRIREKALLREDRTGYNSSLEIFKIKDSVRTTIIVQKDQLQNVVNELGKNKMCIKKKEHKAENNQGYSGFLFNVRSSNGLIGEIQVNTPEMIYAKEKPDIAKSILGEDTWKKIRNKTGIEGGLGHEYYEQFRTMKVDDPHRIELERKSFEYYNHFR